LHFWKSEIFFILGLDTISEKQNHFPRLKITGQIVTWVPTSTTRPVGI
jgi:hypothetical protein